jgi:hypothetical protein
MNQDEKVKKLEAELATFHGMTFCENQENLHLKKENKRLLSILNRLQSGNKNMIDAALETQIDLLKEDHVIMRAVIKTVHNSLLMELGHQSWVPASDEHNLAIINGVAERNTEILSHVLKRLKVKDV